LSENNLPVCLALLRVSRGWNQEDLARAANVRAASISSYERGKLVPSIKMLYRLTSAMGYTLSALEEAQAFLLALRTQSATQSTLERTLGVLSQEEATEPEEGELEPEAATAARQREIEHASIEVGRVATRLTRLFFTLVEPRLASGAPGENGEDVS